MMTEPISIDLPGGLEVEFPKLAPVRQIFNTSKVTDIPDQVAQEFGKFADTDLKDKSVALCVGSRGIKEQFAVLVATIAQLKAAGAKPYMVPAMGSHGGGTAEGQMELLNGYGYSEESLGVPFKSSMEVVELGRLPDGMPVYCDKHAYEADFYIPFNRIKPHTDFKAKHESGLIKMLAIGISKHEGAATFHTRGFENFHTLIPAAAEVFLAKTRVLFGVAMVENAHEDLSHLEFVAPADFFKRDAAMQEMAKANLPRLPLPSLDILVLHEMGKNISGSGIDPNVIGRPGSRLPGFDAPPIECIVTLNITPQSHGNATGLGLSDITTHRLVNQVNWSATYVNCATAGNMPAASLPMVTEHDLQALQISMRCCRWNTPADVRMVVAHNTLELELLWVSEALLPEVAAHDGLEQIGNAAPLQFNADNLLTTGFPDRTNH
ncbi:lactate racemase domain-containing protein [Ruegeria hyattellae]|uniref:lactate racemase domain-containing protein n=1 Tax=Ruegeria hyattellae TaxID=3233337 RepID=UPI00355BF50D